MTGLVVADSTCLIGLERIGRLDLLQALFKQILIPPEVEREFGSSLSWLRIHAPTNRELVASLRIVVDDGEAEAIALACEERCPVMLDDRHARSVASGLGLRMIGTIGILIRAKNQRTIPEIRSLLDALEANGFRIGAPLKQEALRLAGE